jgi:aryl-alcohol dehydrogenase-like predicted oxidoreductase
MQDHYNLLYREEGREMHGLCARSRTDALSISLYSADDREIVQRVARLAELRGVPRAQIALAWMLSKPVVTAPLVGATRIEHSG